jgi:hypothetical protein
VLRIIWIAGLFALVALGLPAASSADNHQIFTDGTNDQTSAYAYIPDITTTEVTSNDNGDAVFRVSMNELAATFYVGNTFAIYIDTDSNASTGSNGIDTGLIVETGPRKYWLCNYHPQQSCDEFTSNQASDVRTGTNSHAVTFSVSTSNQFLIRFYVLATHQDRNNASAPRYQDRAPDTGWYQYDMGADLDHDGVAGRADTCPTVQGGKFDTDKEGVKDGCPPRLPVPQWNYGHGGSGRFAFFSSFRVINAGNGIAVTARFPGLTVHRRGSGVLRAISRRRFRIGSLVTVVYTNKNYFGSYRVARIGAGGFLQQVRTGCTSPGVATFIDCPTP